MSTDGSALGYAELLRLATSKGLQELDATIVQIPSDGNHGHAVVTASVRTASALYRAIGEAWWDGAASGRTQALVAAELRAKTRALCEAVGMPQAVGEGVGSAPRSQAVNDAGGPRAAAQPTMAARPLENAAPVARPVARDAEPAPSPAPRTGMQGDAQPARPAAVPVRSPDRAGKDDDGTSVRVVDEAPGAQPARSQPVRPAPRPLTPVAEGLGPDILQKLLQMTRRIGDLKQEELTEEEALAKLDSFFQRAFNHPLAEGTRMEGQRVVQRLAADLARLSQERGEAGASAAS